MGGRAGSLVIHARNCEWCGLEHEAAIALIETIRERAEALLAEKRAGKRERLCKRDCIEHRARPLCPRCDGDVEFWTLIETFDLLVEPSRGQA